jgi:hypothetical protein
MPNTRYLLKLQKPNLQVEVDIKTVEVVIILKQSFKIVHAFVTYFGVNLKAKSEIICVYLRFVDTLAAESALQFAIHILFHPLSPIRLRIPFCSLGK